MIDYVRLHKDELGVEPICRVLSDHGIKIASSTDYHNVSRKPSKRALRDAEIVEVIKLTADSKCRPLKKPRFTPRPSVRKRQIWSEPASNARAAFVQVKRRMRAIERDPENVRLILSGFGVRVPDGAPPAVRTRVILDRLARVLALPGRQVTNGSAPESTPVGRWRRRVSS